MASSSLPRRVRPGHSIRPTLRHRSPGSACPAAASTGICAAVRTASRCSEPRTADAPRRSTQTGSPSSSATPTRAPWKPARAARAASLFFPCIRAAPSSRHCCPMAHGWPTPSRTAVTKRLATLMAKRRIICTTRSPLPAAVPYANRATSRGCKTNWVFELGPTTTALKAWAVRSCRRRALVARASTPWLRASTTRSSPTHWVQKPPTTGL
jgi:hypothetical protein